MQEAERTGTLHLRIKDLPCTFSNTKPLTSGPELLHDLNGQLPRLVKIEDCKLLSKHVLCAESIPPRCLSRKQKAVINDGQDPRVAMHTNPERTARLKRSKHRKSQHCRT